MHVCVTQVKNHTEHEMHMVFDAGTHSYECVRLAVLKPRLKNHLFAFCSSQKPAF